jgi:hypothetical protein
MAKAMSFAENNVNAAFDLAQKLVRAKDVNEVLALQSEFAKSQMAAMQTQAKGLCHVVENWVRFCRNSATITPQRRLHATSAWPMPGRLGAFLLR